MNHELYRKYNKPCFCINFWSTFWKKLVRHWCFRYIVLSFQANDCYASHPFPLSVLLFCYLLFKVGICQCIARSLCKICWAACETYWDALQDITCFLWHKLKNTKRRNRHHHIRDAELGYSTSSDESDFTDKYRHLSSGRKCYRDRKNWYANGSRHHHHMKLRTREVSFHVKGRSRRLRNSRQLQLIKVRYPRRISKRRRIRWCVVRVISWISF